MINDASDVLRTSGSSQASQDESAVCNSVRPEQGKNEIITSTENTPDI